MKNVKVLGTGCANCTRTQALIQEVARAQGIQINLEKVEDPREIISYNVLRTPAVVIEGKLVHAGGVPERNKVVAWLGT